MLLDDEVRQQLLELRDTLDRAGCNVALVEWGEDGTCMVDGEAADEWETYAGPCTSLTVYL